MKSIKKALMAMAALLFAAVLIGMPFLALGQNGEPEPAPGVKIDVLLVVNVLLFVAGAVAFTYLGIVKGKLQDLRDLLSVIVEALKDNTITKEEAELIRQAARKLIGKS